MTSATERSPLLPPSSALARGYSSMKRSDTFQSDVRQPLVDHPKAKLNEDKIQGYVIRFAVEWS